MRLSVDPSAKALIFDMDGTLVDTMPSHLKALHAVCNPYGITIEEDFVYAKAGIPTHLMLEMYFKENKINFDHHELARLKEEKFLEFIYEVKPLEIVADIARNNFGRLPMSIGTGGTREVVDKTLKASYMDKYFNIIVTFEDVKNGKPAPDIFLLCAEKMGIDPKFCQVFEDGDPGLEAARSAGMIATDIRPYIKKL